MYLKKRIKKKIKTKKKQNKTDKKTLKKGKKSHERFLNRSEVNRTFPKQLRKATVLSGLFSGALQADA